MVEFTGERLVPGQVDPDLWNEHISRYAFASRLARHKRVLDIACGMGYGSAALATVAERVVGLDISLEAVEAARSQYQALNLEFIAAPAQHVPLPDASFDLIVAFEVIEHLNDWPDLLNEARRLLAPGGQFIVSTPNKEYYAETRRLAGPNPYHVHEFEFEEFKAELGQVFPSVTMFLQNHIEAISFQPAPSASAGSMHVIAEQAAGSDLATPEASHFYLAVCALTQQTGSPNYLYLPSSTNVLREREHHITKLEGELAQKDAWLKKLESEHATLHEAHQQQVAEHKRTTAWALELNEQLKAAQARIVELQDELAEKIEGYEAALTAQAERHQAHLQVKLEELAKCVQLLDKAEQTVIERTEWAQKLDERVQQLEQQAQQIQASKWMRLGRKLGIGPSIQNS